MSGGYYLLILELKRGQRIRVGALGVVAFEPGYYTYAGSARGGLEARVARHLRVRGKKKHWHIDYLRQRARVVETILFPAATPADRAELERKLRRFILDQSDASTNGISKKHLSALTAECLLAACAAALPGAGAPAPGFGASDCGCSTHLFFFEDYPDFRALKNEQNTPIMSS